MTDKPVQISDGKVVTLHYTLKVDEEVVDTSEGREPIQFIQGKEQIIPGLEAELYGMTSGESKNVVVEPQSGYGEVQPEAGLEVPKEDFPEEIPLEPGTELQLRNQNGEIINARIDSVERESIHLDFNHPLAGKDLHFDVTVVDVREASADELSQGNTQ
ncbi:MAG: peptidylprolyl isomerase [Anaerolineales bacterium]|nr:peptidylprolyl isomerase [Anaerolineales bacterium]